MVLDQESLLLLVSSGVFFTSFINDSFDHGQQVYVILTDFSEAFDTVDHLRSTR